MNRLKHVIKCKAHSWDSVSDSSPGKMISRSLPRSLDVSLSHRLSWGQPGQLLLYKFIFTVRSAKEK